MTVKTTVKFKTRNSFTVRTEWDHDRMDSLPQRSSFGSLRYTPVDPLVTPVEDLETSTTELLRVTT